MFPWVEQGEVFGKAVVPRFGLGHEKMKAAFSTAMLNLNNNNKKNHAGGQMRAQISCRDQEILFLILQDEGFTLKTLSFSDTF